MTATGQGRVPLPPRPGGVRLPDFLLVGAMKAGTTTLSSWLQQHPDLYMCRPKEPQFFSRAEAAARGWDWYGSLFDEARPGQLLGEASTCYSRWPHFGDVAGSLAEHVPQARLIFLLRHPAERAYSHYRHEVEQMIARRDAPMRLEEALEHNPEIVDASLYPMQIDRFLEHYPEDRILLLLTDDLQAEPEATWRRVQSFLGVPPRTLARGTRRRANEFGDYLATSAMEERLADAHESPTLRLARRLVPAGLRARVRRALIDPRASRRLLGARVEAGRAAVSPLSAQVRAQLVDRFAETTTEMEVRLERELAGWRR